MRPEEHRIDAKPEMSSFLSRGRRAEDKGDKRNREKENGGENEAKTEGPYKSGGCLGKSKVSQEVERVKAGTEADRDENAETSSYESITEIYPTTEQCRNKRLSCISQSGAGSTNLKY